MTSLRSTLSWRRYAHAALCLFLVISLLGLAGTTGRMKAAPNATAPTHGEGLGQQPETTHAVFSNPSAITPADRPSNGAGTNPGLPALYPSGITVSGLNGTVSKVVVSFMVSSTFPDDLDVLLVGPTGARSLVVSDGGGSGDLVGVGFNFDQAQVQAFPDGTTTPVPGGAYRPADYAGLTMPEPGGADNFPAPGPGLLNYAADFTVFNGTNPNGVWNLYVVDDQNVDTSALNGGWVIDITTATTGCQSAKRPVDVNGDGKSDFQVARSAGPQSTWYTLVNGGGFTATQWGSQNDQFLPSDYDGDGKADIAVWRAGTPANFYILQSATNTLRIVSFGLTGDDPSVVGDYDGDGKVDPAVYRPGSGGNQSVWYYLSSVNGLVQAIPWGLNGDFAIPGDFDGDGKYDQTIQRNAGGGQAVFYRRFSNGGSDGFNFGLSTDVVSPGYYDSDCKQDIAVVRNQSANLVWYVLNSSNNSVVGYAFGSATTDLPAQGDYDGDGRIDVTVWRTNNGNGQSYYFWLRSTDNTLGVQNWGLPGDLPTANFNSH